MSILVDDTDRVIVQGITGTQGQFHARKMAEYGTAVVGGVVPGRGGEEVAGIPVFDTVEQAVTETNATASVVLVPPTAAGDAIMEALDTSLSLVVAVTEGIPVQDMRVATRRAQETDTRFIGPNSPGIITPGETKLGILPGEVFSPGSVGVISRSGTLTYEIVDDLTDQGIGQSTAMGIGGDPVIGTSFREGLELFERDAATDAIVLCGEIGGEDEELAADYVAETMETPVVGFIAGRSAPEGKRMGHAGAIVSAEGTGTARSKIDAFEAAGIPVAQRPSEIPSLVDQVLDDK